MGEVMDGLYDVERMYDDEEESTRHLQDLHAELYTSILSLEQHLYECSVREKNNENNDNSNSKNFSNINILNKSSSISNSINALNSFKDKTNINSRSSSIANLKIYQTVDDTNTNGYSSEIRNDRYKVEYINDIDDVDVNDASDDGDKEMEEIIQEDLGDFEDGIFGSSSRGSSSSSGSSGIDSDTGDTGEDKFKPGIIGSKRVDIDRIKKLSNTCNNSIINHHNNNGVKQQNIVVHSVHNITTDAIAGCDDLKGSAVVFHSQQDEIHTGGATTTTTTTTANHLIDRHVLGQDATNTSDASLSLQKHTTTTGGDVYDEEITTHGVFDEERVNSEDYSLDDEVADILLVVRDGKFKNNRLIIYF